MRQFVTESKFDFMGGKKLAWIISGVLITVAIASIAIRGLNLGVDFTGGYTIQAAYEKAPDLNLVRSSLVDAGFEEAVVQNFGSSTEILIRMAPQPGASNVEVSNQVEAALQPSSDAGISMQRVEFVGPQVGEELREKGGLAVLMALFGIVIYIWFRFEKKFSVGSVAALVHDVILTLGVFALFQVEFDLTILAAILAVIGYSLNDTIVVFDRIRENFRTMRSGTPAQVMNASINQTLSRTLVTSLTTLLVLFSLFIFGGKIINGFALALIIGVVVGTYSSIYVASTVVLSLGITKEELMPVEKEGADLESTP